jgi:hypothetical protein
MDFAEALRDHTPLTSLSLENNNIGEDGATALAGSLRGNTPLRSLNLEGNKFSTEDRESLRRVGNRQIDLVL